ncbi:MAG: phenylacetate--CoA ligase family protein [Candidatus Omnitrophica bacterium]|nr:phenylacetate--CoA ligase family protein [Candidatus Omnitrophota bacterium]
MYSAIYENVLFPLYEKMLRRRNTLSYRRELERSQWLPAEDLKKVQWQKVKRLLSHAYENVPFYRERFDAIGLHPQDIQDPQDFQKIPFLTKEDIRNNQDKLLALNYRNRKKYNQTTGGSTGTPLFFKHDHDNYEYRAAGVKRAYGWAGYRDGEKTLFIWGAPVTKQPFFKKFKHDLDEALKRHVIFNTFYFDETMMEKCLRYLNRAHPAHIIAYTMPLFNFAKYLRQKKQRVHSPRSIIAAAEKLYPYQRELIESVFGCKVFETYGCREVSSIAAECEKHQGMHVNMETIYMEIVKGGECPPQGELGEVVLTDLTNYCMPFIRYKNDDIGAFSERRCECGRGLELVKEIEGRILNTIKTPEGKLIPGEFFIYWFMGFDEIKQFQVRQDSLEEITVTMVPGRTLAESRKKSLLDVIRKIMGDKVRVDFRFVDNIPLTCSGKFQVVISNVPVDFKNN